MGRLGPVWVGMKKQGGWGPSLAVVFEGRARRWRQGAQKGRAGLHLHSSLDSSQEAWAFFLGFRTTSETTGPIHGDWGCR